MVQINIIMSSKFDPLRYFADQKDPASEMPKLDPDPFSPWSSSSSETSHYQQSPLIPHSKCWRMVFTSKSRKSYSNCSYLPEERLKAFNRIIDTTDELRLGMKLCNTITDPEEKANEEEKEFQWAEQYRPKTLKDFICHRGKAEMLRNMVKRGHLGHYIFEGPSGVGKRTMIMAFLREYYGPDKLKTREELKKFKFEGAISAGIQINVRVSSHHVEVNVSELRNYTKLVLTELMKVAKNRHFQRTDHRAIVLYEAEKLSTNSQLSVKSLIESCGSHNTVIFSCSNICKLQHLKSLCTIVQLLPPSTVEIVEVLNAISKQVPIQLPCQLAQKIAENSKNSLPQAIRSLEATWQLNYPFEENQMIISGWENELAKIAQDMIKEQSPKQFYYIGGKFQLLKKYNASPQFIFDMLLRELKKHLNVELQSIITGLFEQYNREKVFVTESPIDRQPQRFHDPVGKNNDVNFMMIEEFIAEFMSIYKVLTWKKKGQHV